MTREESIIFVGTLKTVIKDIPKYNGAGIEEALEMAIKTLEQAPCSDAVSRQAVKEQMIKYGFHAPDMTVIEFVEGLQPVTPQPKTGHWRNGDPICPCCGEDKFKDLDADIWADWQPKYCPNCGAKMIEPQESDHKCGTCKHYTSGEHDGSCGSYICEHYSNWESEDKE